MTISDAAASTGNATASVAAAFVAARREGRSLPDFPGVIPAAMEQAYATQELAIELVPDRIVGWKVGYIAPALQPSLGAERLAGPIFSKRLWDGADGRPVTVPVFSGGFAAVEGEFVYRLANDAAAGKTDWTAKSALELVDTLFSGIEMAGSPLPAINALGPTVVASDFGNNAGLILGREIPHWRAFSDEQLHCETFIDGVSVGKGSAADIAGGPASALAFLLNNLAQRGRPARAGDFVSTGAVTGIHEIGAGQSARVSFGAFGDILCQTEMARPEPA